MSRTVRASAANRHRSRIGTVDRRRLAGMGRDQLDHHEPRAAGNEIVVELTDRQSRLDLERIRERGDRETASSSRWCGRRKRLTNLIFCLASPPPTVSRRYLAARVGMDVVKSRTRRSGGRIDVTTARRCGATFASICRSIWLSPRLCWCGRVGAAMRFRRSDGGAGPGASPGRAGGLRAGVPDWPASAAATACRLLGDRETAPKCIEFNWCCCCAAAQTLALCRCAARRQEVSHRTPDRIAHHAHRRHLWRRASAMARSY